MDDASSQPAPGSLWAGPLFLFAKISRCSPKLPVCSPEFPGSHQKIPASIPQGIAHLTLRNMGILRRQMVDQPLNLKIPDSFPYKREFDSRDRLGSDCIHSHAVRLRRVDRVGAVAPANQIR